MSKTILQVKDLEKTYENGVKALKGVSFDVKEGEFLVIIGLSGSGKSTLLRCINNLHEPTGGQILFKDRNITRLNKKDSRTLRSEIGMIFQHFNLIPRYSVLKNALTGALYRTKILSL